MTTAEDTAKPITLAGTDVEGDTLTFAIVGNPSHGTLTGSGASRTYTPAVNYNGADSFTFTVNDGALTSAPATVSITVTAVNDAPSFTKGLNQSVVESTGLHTVTGWATSISAGPSDESGQSLTFIVTNDNSGLFASPPGVAPNGTLSYTLAATGSGTALVTVKLADNGGTANGGADTSGPQTFTITVTPANQAPIANTQTVTAATAVAKNITLTASDADNDPLTYAIVAAPAHGTLTGTAPNVTYTSAAGYVGSDSFTFRVNDGKVNSNVATVSLSVVTPFTTTSTLTTSSLTPQSSDNETYTVTITPSTLGSEPLASSVDFKVGTLVMAEVPLTFNGTNYTASWTGPLLEPFGAAQVKPGSRTVTAALVNQSAMYTYTSLNKAITIQKEDARVVSTTPATISLGGSATGVVTLSANVTELADGLPGDLRNATVAFIDRTTAATIATVNVGANGVATFDWSVNLGTATTKTYTIGFVVSNYYNRNNTADNATVVVNK